MKVEEKRNPTNKKKVVKEAKKKFSSLLEMNSKHRRFSRIQRESKEKKS